MSKATLEDLKAFVFPKGYSVDLVTEGNERKDEQLKNTVFVDKMHLVSPSGKVVCRCELHPKKVFIFWHVNVTTEFGELWCDESSVIMCKEIDRLGGTNEPQGN